MNKYKLNNSSFAMMFVCLLNSTLLGIIFPFMLHEVKTSIFISLLITFVIGLLMLFLFLKIFNYEPDKDIFKKIEYVFPKPIYKLLSFVLIILVFLAVSIIFWRLTTFISSEFLAKTPNIFIAFLLVLPILYALFYDFDVIARLGIMCVGVGFVLFAFNVISLSSYINLENLKPLLNNDFMHLAKGSIILAFIYMTPAFLTLIVPKNNIINNKKTPKVLLISYILSYLSMSSIFFIILSVMGIQISTLYTFPSYVSLKTLNVLSFMQNTENLNILIWVLFMTFSTAFCLLFIKSGIGTLFNISSKKKRNISILSIFVPFMIFVICMLKYESYLNRYKYVFVPFIIYLLIFVLFMMILLIGKIKNKFKNKRLVS